MSLRPANPSRRLGPPFRLRWQGSCWIQPARPARIQASLSRPGRPEFIQPRRSQSRSRGGARGPACPPPGSPGDSDSRMASDSDGRIPGPGWVSIAELQAVTRQLIEESRASRPHRVLPPARAMARAACTESSDLDF